MDNKPSFIKHELAGAYIVVESDLKKLKFSLKEIAYIKGLVRYIDDQREQTFCINILNKYNCTSIVKFEERRYTFELYRIEKNSLKFSWLLEGCLQ